MVDKIKVLSLVEEEDGTDTLTASQTGIRGLEFLDAFEIDS